jgi:hypothetical protein
MLQMQPKPRPGQLSSPLGQTQSQLGLPAHPAGRLLQTWGTAPLLSRAATRAVTKLLAQGAGLAADSTSKVGRANARAGAPGAISGGAVETGESIGATASAAPSTVGATAADPPGTRGAAAAGRCAASPGGPGSRIRRQDLGTAVPQQRTEGKATTTPRGLFVIGSNWRSKKHSELAIVLIPLLWVTAGPSFVPIRRTIEARMSWYPFTRRAGAGPAPRR